MSSQTTQGFFCCFFTSSVVAVDPLWQLQIRYGISPPLWQQPTAMVVAHGRVTEVSESFLCPATSPKPILPKDSIPQIDLSVQKNRLFNDRCCIEMFVKRIQRPELSICIQKATYQIHYKFHRSKALQRGQF